MSGGFALIDRILTRCCVSLLEFRIDVACCGAGASRPVALLFPLQKKKKKKTTAPKPLRVFVRLLGPVVIGVSLFLGRVF